MKKSQKGSVSAVIPVFNEEKNIAKILKFITENPLIDEIICVNDGSTDNSLSIINKFSKNIHIISYKKNHGKGHAMAQGVKKAKNEIVLFLDADLINVKHKHIKDILTPMFKKEKKAVLGYGTRSRNHFWDSSSFVKSVTGQRAYFRQDLFPYLNIMARKKYGVEIYLNTLFDKKDVELIPLIKVTHIWNHKKHPPYKAIKQYLKLGTEVAQEIGKSELKEMTQAEKIRLRKLKKTIKEEFNTFKNNQTYFLPYINKIHFYSRKVFNYLFEI